jgi:hypothetical protein
LKDIDLAAIGETATSRLNSQHYDLLQRGNNSSSLSNFVLPQTTTRTMKTNRSYMSNGAGGMTTGAQHHHNLSQHHKVRDHYGTQAAEEVKQVESVAHLSSGKSNSQANQTKQINLILEELQQNKK